MRTRFPLMLALFVLLVPFSVGNSYSQEKALRALSWEQVLQLWREESANRLPRDRTRQLVHERGVDFAVDPPRELELRGKKFSIELINEIRKQFKTPVLLVKCEPVECTVRINGETSGTTFGLELKRSVAPGPLTIEVSSPEYQTMTEIVDVEPGLLITRFFRLERQKGSLVVNCEPADCSLLLGGARVGTDARRRWELNSLVSGEYKVEASAEGYKSIVKKVHVFAPEINSVTLRMDVDEWGQLTAPKLFDRMVAAIGNDLLIKEAGTSKSTGRMTLTGDPPGIGNWKAQLTEITMPGKQRWDLKIAGNTWTVAADGASIKSRGDKQYAGTGFGQELENSIRLFSNLRLPSILRTIKSGFRMFKLGVDVEPVLVAESPTDRYTFHLNPNGLPQKLLHEHLTIPQSREEVEFGKYRIVQPGLKLPHVMILRYPDRPSHEQILEFDTIDITGTVKESAFRP